MEGADDTRLHNFIVGFSVCMCEGVCFSKHFGQFDGPCLVYNTAMYTVYALRQYGRCMVYTDPGWMLVKTVYCYGVYMCTFTISVYHKDVEDYHEQQSTKVRL